MPPTPHERFWGFINTGTAHPWLISVGRGWGKLVSCPACWRRQLVGLVTDSSEEMNEVIVQMVQNRFQIEEMFSMAIILRWRISPSQQIELKAPASL